VLGAGCWVLGAGCWVLGAGCWVLGAGCWVLGAGCWVLGAGCWVLLANESMDFVCLRPDVPASASFDLHCNLMPAYISISKLAMHICLLGLNCHTPICCTPAAAATAACRCCCLARLPAGSCDRTAYCAGGPDCPANDFLPDGVKCR
jgi:hypothetical protein